MKAKFMAGSWLHRKHYFIENVTQVYVETGKYGIFSKKADMHICTMSGEEFIVEKIQSWVAQAYMKKMNESGCLDLTESLDHWIYLARKM